MSTKLSEAMRKGAKLHAYGHTTFASITDGELCTCAMGAIAVGRNPSLNRVGDILAAGMPVMDEMDRFSAPPCPACHLDYNLDKIHGTLADTVVVLNDEHKWSREDIADWLAKIGY